MRDRLDRGLHAILTAIQPDGSLLAEDRDALRRATAALESAMRSAGEPGAIARIEASLTVIEEQLQLRVKIPHLFQTCMS